MVVGRTPFKPLDNDLRRPQQHPAPHTSHRTSRSIFIECTILLPVSLLVLLVAKAVGDGSPADADDRDHQSNNRRRVEGRVKDHLSWSG